MDLVAAWRRLPVADQEVLALHVWEGLTDRDAATVLGCSTRESGRGLRLVDELADAWASGGEETWESRWLP
ncbi:RNA polymerase sigma factor [Streptomyces sasae]|uniref:hypothetical protein n=1 Tax=Streptomyces sasae TaxID=1266772 RepID=UPI00292F556A|nr:hypothetical protein [Streptomyces sasae]